MDWADPMALFSLEFSGELVGAIIEMGI